MMYLILGLRCFKHCEALWYLSPVFACLQLFISIQRMSVLHGTDIQNCLSSRPVGGQQLYKSKQDADCMQKQVQCMKLNTLQPLHQIFTRCIGNQRLTVETPQQYQSSFAQDASPTFSIVPRLDLFDGVHIVLATTRQVDLFLTFPT